MALAAPSGRSFPLSKPPAGHIASKTIFRAPAKLPCASNIPTLNKCNTMPSESRLGRWGPNYIIGIRLAICSFPPFQGPSTKRVHPNTSKNETGRISAPIVFGSPSSLGVPWLKESKGLTSTWLSQRNLAEANHMLCVGATPPRQKKRKQTKTATNNTPYIKQHNKTNKQTKAQVKSSKQANTKKHKQPNNKQTNKKQTNTSNQSSRQANQHNRTEKKTTQHNAQAHKHTRTPKKTNKNRAKQRNKHTTNQPNQAKPNQANSNTTQHNKQIKLANRQTYKPCFLPKPSS